MNQFKTNSNNENQNTLKIQHNSDIKKGEGENNYEAIMKQETKVIKKKKPVKKGFGSNLHKSQTFVQSNLSLKTGKDNNINIPKSETVIQNEDKKVIPIKEKVISPKKILFTDENETIPKKENIINPKNELFNDKNENKIIQNTIVPNNNKVNLFGGNNNNNNNKLASTMAMTGNKNLKNKLAFLYDDDDE